MIFLKSTIPKARIEVPTRMTKTAMLVKLRPKKVISIIPLLLILFSYHFTTVVSQYRIYHPIRRNIL